MHAVKEEFRDYYNLIKERNKYFIVFFSMMWMPIFLIKSAEINLHTKLINSQATSTIKSLQSVEYDGESISSETLIINNLNGVIPLTNPSILYIID
jgi:hypothetical protein